MIIHNFCKQNKPPLWLISSASPLILPAIIPSSSTAPHHRHHRLHHRLHHHQPNSTHLEISLSPAQQRWPRAVSAISVLLFLFKFIFVFDVSVVAALFVHESYRPGNPTEKEEENSNRKRKKSNRKNKRIKNYTGKYEDKRKKRNK